MNLNSSINRKNSKNKNIHSYYMYNNDQKLGNILEHKKIIIECSENEILRKSSDLGEGYDISKLSLSGNYI